MIYKLNRDVGIWKSGTKFDTETASHISSQIDVDIIYTWRALNWLDEVSEVEGGRWKPENGEIYFFVIVDSQGTRVDCYRWSNDSYDKSIYRTSPLFKTREEAQAKAQRVREVLLAKG